MTFIQTKPKTQFLVPVLLKINAFSRIRFAISDKIIKWDVYFVKDYLPGLFLERYKSKKF